MADRKTLVNKDGRRVFVDTADAEAAFRAKGYLGEGEEPAKEPAKGKADAEDEPHAGKGKK